MDNQNNHNQIHLNLSGFSFLFEAHAYELLVTYFKKIEVHIEEPSERQEIMEDVERRVVELFQNNIKTSSQTIEVEDVEYIISILGKPEDFSGGSKKRKKRSYKKSKSGSKKVYRSTTNKKLAGVCGGLAEYLDIDALWLRLAFVVAFFTVGGSLIVYIILWIVLPKSPEEYQPFTSKNSKFQSNPQSS